MKLTNTTSSQDGVLTEAEGLVTKRDSGELTCEEAPNYVEELQNAITSLIGLAEEMDEQVTELDEELRETKGKSS